MAKWITNWTATGEVGKWGRCTPAFAAEVIDRGGFRAVLVPDSFRVSRIILITPAWAEPLATMFPAMRSAASTPDYRPAHIAFSQRSLGDRFKGKVNSHLAPRRNGAEKMQKPKAKPMRIPPAASRQLAAAA